MAEKAAANALLCDTIVVVAVTSSIHVKGCQFAMLFLRANVHFAATLLLH